MKKILIMVVATGFLFACNTGGEKGKAPLTEPLTVNQADHPEQPQALALNNGAKWKADSTTLMNVALLQQIVSDPKNGSLDNYSKMAEGLQAGLNKMVSECKMKGDDHEALHHWLEPLIEQTKELKSAASTEDARAIFSRIKKQINLFSQYFG